MTSRPVFVLGSFVIACSAKVPRFPRPGEALAADIVTIEPGGKGFNLAIMARRLGMAVKLENLGRLQADHPERRRVVTGNDGTNSWMVSINEALGFRIVELCPAYQRRLA